MSSKILMGITIRTVEGGKARQYINKTGGVSVKGTIVKASTTTGNAVDIAEADSVMPIGVIYEDGVADGSYVFVVTRGPVYVLLKDSTATTTGNWAYVSDVAGRADASLAAPPGGGIPELDAHQGEIGHSLESVGAGTNKLCLIELHFN